MPVNNAKCCRSTLLFSIIVILGYIAKDRIKELGKRYLEPIGAALGVAFPDRVRKLHDYTGKVVGKCYEKAETVGSGKVPPLVQDVRHADKGALKRKHPSIQPERVIHYKKTIRVKWQKVGVQLQHTTHEGLDDVLAIDLSFLQQRMQPPTETHYKLWTSEEGKFGVDKVHCARTYHINIVLQIKSLANGANEKSMVIQRARVIMDKACGIKRLENQEDSIDLQKKQLLRPFTNAVASTMDRVSTAAVHAAARAKSSSHLGTAQQDQQRQRVNQGM